MKILWSFLLLMASAFGTTVTGTITDSNGNPWKNGTASAYSVTSSGQPGSFSATPVSTGSTGLFTLTLAPGNYIFTLCAPPYNIGPTTNPTPTQVCFSSGVIVISGGSQDVSSTLNALSVSQGVQLGPQGLSSLGASTLTTLTVTGNSSLNGGGNLSGTFTGNPTLSGNPTFNGSTTLTGGAISGTWTGSPTASGNWTLSGNNTFTGSNTFSGSTFTATLENVLYVDSTSCGTTWAGSDIGACINSAYAALPATGGKIHVARKTGGGPYSFSTPITFTTSHKTALLECDGPAGTANLSMNQGTILAYTPTTSTSAITLDDLDSSGSGGTKNQGVVGCAIWNGTAAFTPGGTGSSAIGIACGNTNGGCEQAKFEDDFIGGFGTGISIPNNTSWGYTIVRTSIDYNTTGLSSTGENVNITDSLFLGNGTAITSNNGEINWKGGSCDSSTVTCVNFTNAASGALFHSYAVHYENLGIGDSPPASGNCGSNAAGMPYIKGNPNAHVYLGTMIDDCNNTSTTYAGGFISIGTTIETHGVQFATKGRTESSGVIQITGSGISRVWGDAYIQSSALPTTPATFIGGSQAEFSSFTVYGNTTNQTNVVSQFEGSIAVGSGHDLSGGGVRLLEPNSLPGSGTASTAELRADTSGNCNFANNGSAFVKCVGLAGDLGNTGLSPQVLSTHLSAALPVNQGGTGQTVASTFSSSAVSYAGLMLCGTTTACANTGLGNTGRSIFGSCPFSASTTCTVTGITAFTSASSFFCVVTEASNTGVTFRVQNPSATSFTITASASNSDTVNYHCDGN